MRIDQGVGNGAGITADAFRMVVTSIYEFNYIFVNEAEFNIDWCDSYWCERRYWWGYYD
jgi:hypothetical protein